MKKPKPQFANNINYLRNQQNLTLKEAAEKSGISFDCWRSYEEGVAFPHHSKLEGMCNTLAHYDVLSLINRDLSIEQVPGISKPQQAIAALKSVKQFLENIKVNL